MERDREDEARRRAMLVYDDVVELTPERLGDVLERKGSEKWLTVVSLPRVFPGLPKDLLDLARSVMNPTKSPQEPRG